MEAIFQMEDFSIFGRDWQLEIGERRLKGNKKLQKDCSSYKEVIGRSHRKGKEEKETQ